MTRMPRALGVALLLAVTPARADVILSPDRYELDLRIHYATETLEGAALITLTNPSPGPVSEASFMLYRLLRVESVRDADGHDLAFRQDVVSFEDFPPLQVNQIRATLAQPLEPGAHTTLRIAYAGYLLGYSETGMRYVQDRIDSTFTIIRDDAFAYPKPGHASVTDMRAAPEPSFSYVARITVPKTLRVANAGHLDGVDSLGNEVTFRYTSVKPSWRMDFAIAKYGELSAGAVRIFYLPDDRDGASGLANAGTRCLELFTRWFGPLRGTTGLTVIEIPDGWGSQTDVACIIQTAAAFRDTTRYRELYHEISHMWNVTPTDRPSPRWNEGLASYLELRADEELSGRPVTGPGADRTLAHLHKRLPGNPRWRDVPMIDYGRTGMAGLSYSMGAVFFDLLDRLVGRDTFNRIIGRYYADHREKGGSTDDLAALIRRSTKMDMSPLLTDWFYTPAWTDRVEHHATMQDLVSYYRDNGGKRAGK